MSDRLTSPGTSSSTHPLELAFPAALILVALFSHVFGRHAAYSSSFVEWAAPADQQILFSGLAVIFALQCGILLRGMLPHKAPFAHKVLTSTFGALAASLPLSLTSAEFLIPWILALAGWNLLTHFTQPAFVPRLLSGLCTGLSLSLSMSTVVVVIPILVGTLFSLKQPGRKAKQTAGCWILAFLAGLSPLFLGVLPAHRLPLLDPEVETVHRLLTELFSNMNWALFPFLLLGTGVACFQSKKTLFGLFLPILFGLPFIMLGFVLPESISMMHLPVALLTGYGVFRIVRGIEQGIRNVSASTAKTFVPAVTVITLLSYVGFLALNSITF